MPKQLIARLAREHGPKLIDKAVGRAMGGGKAGAGADLAKDAPIPKPGLTQRIATGLLIRIATKSVPGAIIVGGGLLAKHLYAKKRAKDQAKDQNSAAKAAPPPAS